MKLKNRWNFFLYHWFIQRCDVTSCLVFDPSWVNVATSSNSAHGFISSGCTRPCSVQKSQRKNRCTRSWAEWRSFIPLQQGQWCGGNVLKRLVEMWKNVAADDAISLFNEMTWTQFSFSIQACEATCNLEDGKKIHQLAVRKGFWARRFCIYSYNRHVHQYMNCSSPHEAIELFERIPKKDLVSWNALISHKWLCSVNRMLLLLLHVWLNRSSSLLSNFGCTFLRLLSCQEFINNEI